MPCTPASAIAERLGHGALDQLGQAAPARRLVVGAGPEGGPAGRGRGIEPQPDEDVDVQLVGLLGLHGVVGVVQLGDPGPAERQAAAQRAGHAARARRSRRRRRGGPAGWVARRAGRPGPAPTRPARDRGGGSRGAAARAGWRRPTMPSTGSPALRWNSPERAHGGVAEDAVDPAGVEAEGAQALLELGHVVTPQHRGPAVQEAVTQPETGLDQGVPGLRAADAVDAQAAQALEGLERRPGWRDRRCRRRRRARPGRMAVRRCWTSETASPRSPMASGRPTGRPRSPRAAAPLGFAPIRRTWGSPSLNRISVGMLITSKRRVTSRLSSMLSLPIRILPACSSAISSSTGEIILHGPHHSAQKSTRTGTSELLTCSSKVASVRVSIFSLMASPCQRVQRAPRPDLFPAHSPALSSQRSASMAAMQPDPAEVTAWR